MKLKKKEISSDKSKSYMYYEKWSLFRLYLFLFDRKNSFFEIDKKSAVNPINLTKLTVIGLCVFITGKYSFPNS